MDFFAQQEMARRNTRRLVWLYALAVVLIVLAVHVAVAVVFQGATGSAHSASSAWETAATGGRVWRTVLNADLFAAVATVTLLVIGVGTLVKIRELAGGGAAVASMLGGVRVPPTTSDPACRRLLNVVEEMAIASGIPVPQVFVLEDEDGINAFAAGYEARDAVVAVTRGCLRRLDRSELQGVVGHEFSHILNGDMRLNIRLIGLLSGILAIAVIGRILLRTATTSRSSSRGSRKGGNPLPLLGLALMVIGGIGVLFARLIQAAVSRQREFLADAAAVQFTRNPMGLAGALKKIGGLAEQGALSAPRAQEASHLFFANGLAHSWFSLFATHPPLEARIRLLDPSFSGSFPATGALPEDDAENTAGAAGAMGLGGGAGVMPPPVPSRRAIPFTPRSVLPQVGVPLPAHLDQAARILAGLPPQLLAAARVPASAPQVVMGLLLAKEPGLRERQLGLLAAQCGAGEAAAVREMLPLLAAVSPTSRLPLAQITLPALRALPPDDRTRLLAVSAALVDADGEVSLFEYMLRRMLARQLAAAPARPAAPVRVMTLANACGQLLSTLAWVSSDAPEAAQAAFREGARELMLNPAPQLLPADLCGLAQADAALTRLEAAPPAAKRRILAACTACVSADGFASVEEAELLRAVADALDCPIPPVAATPIPA